jgi:hypothetical protein
LKLILVLFFIALSNLSIAHDPIEFNTQDIYIFGSLMNSDYQGKTMYQAIGLTPGVGIGSAISGVKLGYGQVYIEGGYNYLGTFGRVVYEDNPPSRIYLYQEEEILENIYVNLKISYPLSDSILMNWKFGHSYLNSKYSANDEFDRGGSFDVPDKSYGQSTSMAGLGVEYLINRDSSVLVESINYGSGIRSLVASILFRL